MNQLHTRSTQLPFCHFIVPCKLLATKPETHSRAEGCFENPHTLSGSLTQSGHASFHFLSLT